MVLLAVPLKAWAQQAALTGWKQVVQVAGPKESEALA
jgi:hypothetical protein